MRVVYAEHCHCDLVSIADPRTIRRHCATDAEAAAAFLDHARRYHCGRPGSHADAACCHFHAGRRYWSIHGPGGHVVAVR